MRWTRWWPSGSGRNRKRRFANRQRAPSSTVLRECGALGRIYPEIDALFGVPQPAEWHPEIDTGLHTLMVLDQAVRLSEDPKVRFAALLHDVGKGETPPVEWPSHRGHEERSVALIEALAVRLRVPSDYRDLAVIVARHHGIVHRAFELKPKTILEFMERADAFRRPERFAQALIACEADSRGRTGLETKRLSAASIPAGGGRGGWIHQAICRGNRLAPGGQDRGAAAPPTRAGHRERRASVVRSRPTPHLATGAGR